jgi:predicted esterase
MKTIQYKMLFLSVFLSCGRTFSGANEPTPHQTGSFRATFTETHAVSTQEEFKRRRNPEAYEDYTIQDESFQLIVPQTYRENRPHGLIVWISASDNGSIPGSFQRHLSDLHFIAVGANRSGNNRSVYSRKLLALDAVHNLKRFYNIDADRVIISGNSGGGRTAAEVAVAYPDVFTGGGYYVIGANYHGRMNLEGSTKFWPAKFSGEPPLYDLAKTRPYVFHTGSKDFNQADTFRVYSHYLKDDFEHCLYIEDEGLGHSTPGAASILNGLKHMNKGLEETGQKLLEDSRPLIQQGRFGDAYALLVKAEIYGNPTAKEWIKRMGEAADQELESANDLLKQENLPDAHAAFSQMETRFGPYVGKPARLARETLEQNPVWKQERAAADILSRIQQSYSPENPDITIGHLERLMEEYPGTRSAMQAKEALDKLRGSAL